MALDPNKKFLYFNKDETLGESDDALCFPVSSFIGIETQTSARVLFYFEGSKGVDATTVRVSHNQHAYIKTFMSFLVDEINFGEKAFIKVYDHAQRASYPSDVTINMGTDIVPAFTLEDATIDLGTVLSVEYGGTGASTLTADGVLFGNGTSAISAVDLSTNGNVIVGGATPAVVTGANLAGSGLAATVGDGTLVLAVETLNQDTTGNATTATLAASTSGVVVTDESSDVTCFPLFVTAATGTDLPTKSGGNLTFNSNSGLLSATGMTAAGFTGDLSGDVIGNVEGDVEGNADTATALATARAINGVDFDGTGAITVTAAGSTLSDTVTVAKGGTGASTLTDNGVLFGNGTSAISAVDLSSNGNIIVGGSTPAAVTGANLAGAGLAATVGDGTLVLAVETLNQDTTGTAATVTGAAQTNITSLGTLTNLNVDNININTSTIQTGSGNDMNITASGDLNLTATGNDVNVDTDNFKIESASSHMPYLTLTAVSNTSDGGHIQFKKDRGAAAVNNDIIGTIDWLGENDAQEPTTYGIIIVEALEVDDTDEAGRMIFKVAESNGSVSHQTAGLVIEGSDNATDGEVNVIIAAGAASTTTIAGNLTMGSTATINNSGVVQVAAQTVIDHDQLANFAANEHYTQANIVATGTIASGTWEGTDVGVAHGGTGLSSVAENTMLTGNGTGALTAEANLTYDGTNLSLASDGVSAPDLTLLSTSNHVTGSNFVFKKLRADNTPVDGDIIGTVVFQGEDDNEAAQVYASIIGLSKETGSGEEGGKLKFNIATHDGEQQPGLIIEDGSAEDEVDVTIANGAASVTTVAGDLRVNGTDIYGPTDGDLQLRSDGNIALFLDGDGDESSQFQVINDASGPIFTVTEAGVGALNNQTIVTGGKIAVASEAQAPIGMHIARRTITTAEANAMNSTPIEVVPAQGANTIIVPVNCLTRVDRAANQTNSACDMNAHYADKEPGVYNTASLFHWRRFMVGETTDHSEMRGPTEGTSGVTLTESVNKGIELSFDSAATTNCFTSIDIFMTYYIIDIS